MAEKLDIRLTYSSWMFHRKGNGVLTKAKKKQKYDKTNLIAAIRAVQRGKGISKTSRLYGIPKTTLFDHSKGRLIGSVQSPGRKLSLTMEEEQTLVNYIMYMASRGRPLTNDILKKFATALIRRKEHEVQIDKLKGPSDKWCQRFRKRHPEIKLKKPDRASNPRMEVSREDVEEYFDLLEETLNRLDIKDKPECVYNCDETGICGKEVIRGKVLVKDNQHPYQEKVNSSSGHLSINMAISASGSVLPLMLIFAKNLPRNLDGLPGDWMLETSQKGYMNGELFLKWLREHFIHHCGRQRPVLLIMDNLASHISPDVIDLARRNQIELLCLPPNSTHLLQPLDVAVFHKFKGEYTKMLNQLGYSFSAVPREKIPHVVKYALNCMCPRDYITSFRRAGIFPADRLAVLDHGKQTLRSRQDIASPRSLVDIGLVPEALAEIFQVAPEKSTTRKTGNKGARLITVLEPLNSESQISSVSDNPTPSTSKNSTKQKESKSNTRNVSKQKRKPVKSRTKRKKAEQNPEEQSTEMHLDDGICEICMLNTRLEWVGCDICTRWYHYVCLPHPVQADVDLSIVTSSDWQCNGCIAEE